MSEQAAKAAYKLLYPAPFPGRGEHIRLLLEETGTPYTEGTLEEYNALKDPSNLGDDHNTPLFAGPFLQHGDLTISQTSSILQFLGKQLGLSGDPKDEYAVYRLNGLALTALDGFSDEVHDCHHPLGGGLYYEDQKEESIRSSKEYIKERIPKFLEYFERVLKGKASGEGPYLYGGMLTYADLVLFQCLDGTVHQFPKAMKHAEKSGEYDLVLGHWRTVRARPKIKAYLESERRLKYGMGVYRHYPELDFDPDEL